MIVTDYRLAELSSAEWKVSARAERISDEAAAISGYDAEAWKGAPQSVASHQFIDRGPDDYGFFMEASPQQPAARGQFTVTLLPSWVRSAPAPC